MPCEGLRLMGQVTGDLWERYVKMLDEQIPDGLVTSTASLAALP